MTAMTTDVILEKSASDKLAHLEQLYKEAAACLQGRPTELERAEIKLRLMNIAWMMDSVVHGDGR